MLFVLCGGRPSHQIVGGRYGLQLPSATRVRKIGATTVAVKYGQSPKASLVTRQMSHSLNTEATYYQAIVGDQHAATAYTTMAELQQGTPTKQAEKSPEPPKEWLPVMPSPKCTPRQRRRFSEEKTEDVKKFFQEQIENGMGVSLREC